MATVTLRNGIGPENIEGFNLALEGEPALTPWLERQAKVLGQVKGPDVAGALGGLVSDVDKAALTGEFAEFIATVFRQAVSSGIAGWRDDDLAFTRDWGFDLAQIERPVAVWQGEQDRMVPFTHGQCSPTTFPMRASASIATRATCRSP